MTSAERRLVTETVSSADFRRAAFGGPARGPNPAGWVRVAVRAVEVRGERAVQFSFFDARQDTTRNVPPADAPAALAPVLDAAFANVHVSTVGEEIEVRTSKKGKVLVTRRPAARDAAPAPHNRVKDVPLPEGRPDPFLQALGVLAPDGQVRATMRAKFTQINEFLKHLGHALDDAGLRTPGRELSILDCGCGSSYLTLAAHHFLNHTLGIPAAILGVDVNADVIRKSAERADRVGAAGLSFACGRISAMDVKADIVIALHACDTATDDAIAQAVRSEAKMLLSVPCCHHALNRDLGPHGLAEVLRPVLRHNILRQRAADLVTDAFRALALRILGYRTEVVEFVSPEHTARNLMIRAVRGAPAGEAAFVDEYRELKRFWGVTPYIERALGEGFAGVVRGRESGQCPPVATGGP